MHTKKARTQFLAHIQRIDRRQYQKIKEYIRKRWEREKETKVADRRRSGEWESS